MVDADTDIAYSGRLSLTLFDAANWNFYHICLVVA